MSKIAPPKRAWSFFKTQTYADLVLKMNGDGGQPFTQVTVMHRQLERCKACKPQGGVVETSHLGLELPEMWVPAQRQQLYRRVREERSERSLMAASDDSANGSMSVGQMDPDRSVRKSNVTLPHCADKLHCSCATITWLYRSYLESKGRCQPAVIR